MAVSKRNTGKKIPDRYAIKSSPEGSYITCLESPNITVRIEKGKVFSESNAKKAQERTIYLDGVCDSPPFLDMKKQIYNLDHHTGIIRSFTLSTCEQATILILKGLDLTEKNWVVWANDPDLDTVLAIWVLLNNIYITGDNPDIPGEIIPIIRLEGLVDGLGLEMTHFTAFPQKMIEETTEKIDLLRKKELAIKKSGKWEETNFPEYTLQVLKRIDELVFSPEDFKDFRGLDELARVELDEKISAVVYSANMGIYEIEQYLNRVFGKNPGLIILQKSIGHYTIRKSDLFTPLDMNHIYDKLNLYDRYVSGKRPKNRWGGAGEIGGSPRETGTALQPQEIAEIAREAFYKPNILEKIVRGSWAGFLGFGLTLLSWLLIGFWQFSDTFGNWILESMGLPYIIFASFLSLYTLGLFWILGSKRFWFYGFRFPSGNDWWFFFPGILIASIFGGTWIPDFKTYTSDSIPIFAFTILIMPISLEILFRGILHGQLVELYRISKPGGDWFISYPVLITSGIYSLFFLSSPIHYNFPLGEEFGDWRWISQVLAGFIFGISSGLCRERSDSIYPAIGFHIVSIIIAGILKGFS